MSDQDRIRRLAEWLNGWGLPTDDWNPLTRIQAARMLEDEVERRGMQAQYGHKLDGVLYERVAVITTWDIAHAYPAQRCEALLRLIDKEADHD